MKILGYTDSRNECDCGKTGLKGVFVVENDNGETLHLGSSCVKKDWDLTQKEFTGKVNEAKVARRAARIEFLAPYNAAFGKLTFRHEGTGLHKYNTEHPAHEEFMTLFNALREATTKMNKELPLIYTK